MVIGLNEGEQPYLVDVCGIVIMKSRDKAFLGPDVRNTYAQYNNRNATLSKIDNAAAAFILRNATMLYVHTYTYRRLSKAPMLPILTIYNNEM